MTILLASLQRHLPFLRWPRPTRELLTNELWAGVTVGLLLVPQGVAYASVAGMPLITGIYASLLPALVAVLFSSSSRLGVGPTALSSLLIGASLAGLAPPGSAQWVTLAVWLSLLSGLFQILLGLGRFGWLLNLVSSPVMNGFTQAAAWLIVASQLPALVGASGDFSLLVQHPYVYGEALVYGLVAIALLLGAKRWYPRFPAAIAIVTLGVAMVPHFRWLQQVDFVPITYAGGTYAISDHWQSLQLVLGYIGHNLALLALPLALAALALAWSPRRWTLPFRDPRAFFAEPWSMRDHGGVRRDQAVNIWIIQGVVAVGPPLGALGFDIYLKTDWGISLFFLVPLCVVAIPTLRVPRAALVRIAAVWLALSLIVLAASPQIAIATAPRNGAGQFTHGSYSQLARELTQAWRQRFHSRWAVVIGPTEVSTLMTFYSPDHPAPLTPDEAWGAGLTSLGEANREGFIGVCEVGSPQQPGCDAWMKDNVKAGERIVMTTRRFYAGGAGAPTGWNVTIVPPSR